MTTKEFAKILQEKLTSEYGVDLSVASKQQIYRSLALICRQMMSENHKKFQSKAIGTGTRKVIRDHSTIGIVVTTDGSISEM